MSDVPKPVVLSVLASLVFIEAAALLALAIYLGIEIFTAPTASVSSATALAVCALIAAGLIVFVAISVFRARPWIRGAVACIAILQVLVALSIFNARAAVPVFSPLVGALILAIPAVAMLVLLFTPAVLRATARPTRDS